MVFSNVIVDVTVPRRSSVFSQSSVQISAGLTDISGLAVAARKSLDSTTIHSHRALQRDEQRHPGHLSLVRHWNKMDITCDEKIALLRSALVCIRGSRPRRVPCDIKNVDIDVEVVEGAIKSDYWCVSLLHIYLFISLLLLFLAGLLGR